jgi:hypothetical protein
MKMIHYFFSSIPFSKSVKFMSVRQAVACLAQFHFGLKQHRKSEQDKIRRKTIMKKSLLLTILGVAASMTAFCGDGYINFANYNATPFYAVVYGPCALQGTQVGANVDVELGWANGSGVTSGFTLIPSSVTAISATWSQPDNGIGDNITGWFVGPTITLTGYTGGPVTFDILAWVASGPYSGGTYDTSLNGSLIWTEPASAIATGVEAPGEFTAMPGDIMIAIIPEPTTLALGILGGLSLLAFRRKQA